MSYPTILVGIAERLQTVPGLVVLNYEPRILAERRAAYFLLDSFTRSQAGQVTVMTYRINCRVCVRWQDNQQAEADLAALINPVCAAIDADPKLGGRVVSGYARVDDAQAEYVDIGGTGAINYRVCNVFITVLEKGAYQGGL